MRRSARSTRALALGEIVESRYPDYRAGEVVTGWFGWQELATVDGDVVIRRVVEADLPIRSPSRGRDQTVIVSLSRCAQHHKLCVGDECTWASLMRPFTDASPGSARAAHSSN